MLNLTRQPMQRLCHRKLIRRLGGFSATNVEKLAYIRLNSAEWRRAVAGPPPSKNRT